jgi:two-component system, NarL family, nitrate/nitrite response regulator NarL
MPNDAPPEALLVEDDPNFALRLCSAVSLWRPDARITLCTTGEEAVAWIAANHRPADLALVDLGLPDMDGCDVIAAARRHSERTPILVVSLLASERAVIGAIRSGANGYIIKDDSDRSIATAITEVMSGNYPLSPALARHVFRLVAGPAPQSTVALTERETDTLRCIGRGLSYEQTAMQMGISLSTVQSHVRNLYRKLEVNSQIQAALKARDRGLI